MTIAFKYITYLSPIENIINDRDSNMLSFGLLILKENADIGSVNIVLNKKVSYYIKANT